MPHRERPNILLIMCDQLKATALGLYGNADCATPSLERMAAGGVRYRHAFTPHPLCVPARVSLWTGQYPHAHGSRRNQTLMAPGRRHAFRAWREMGYRCGLIGKNHCFAHADDLALFDTWCEIDHRGLPEGAHHAGLPWARPPAAIEAAHAVRREMPRQPPHFSYAVTDFPLEDYGTAVVTEQAVRFLDTPREGPFALWVSYPDPHSPIEAPRCYADLFPPDGLTLPPRRADEMARAPERTRVLRAMRGIEESDAYHLRRQMSVYYGMTRFVDDGVGRILDAIDARGLREETIVVFCADHGDFLGEHGLVDKGGAFYDCLERVPLVVSWPGRIAPGRVDDSLVNLVDIVPTLFALQGAEAPAGMQGQPLPTVTDAAPRDAAFAEYGAGGPFFTLDDCRRLPNPSSASRKGRGAKGRRKAIRTAAWKYIHDPLGDLDELYDLQADPAELVNLADDPAYRETIADLRARLLAWSIATEDAEPVPLPDLPELPLC